MMTGFPALARQAQLFDEDFALNFTRRKVIVIIESDFAQRQNASLAQQRSEFVERARLGLGSFVRMDTHRRGNAGIAGCQFNGAIQFRRPVARADGQHAANALLVCALDEGVEIRPELLVVEVDVGVDQLHFSRAPTGTSSRNPASTGLPPSSDAATIIPLEVMPRSFRGFKFATMTTFRPINCSGL